MGQSWQFVNVDKAQTTRRWPVDMDEMFFTEGLSYIIESITVPANAPKNYQKPITGRGSWAGDRIMLIGNHTREWPEKLLHSKSCEALNLKNLSPLEFVYRHAHEVKPWESNYKEHDDKTYPRDCTWILRNLDRRIYVRSNGIPSIVEPEKALRFHAKLGPFAVPGLGSVLLGRIGWSSDSSCSILACSEHNLTKGDWVGDRVDVRLLADIKGELISGGWVDHTNIEAIRTRAFWKSRKRCEDISPEDEKRESYPLLASAETDSEADAEGETDPDYDREMENDMDAEGEDDPMYDKDAEREGDPMYDEDAEGDDDSMCDAEGEDDPDFEEDAEGEIDEEIVTP